MNPIRFWLALFTVLGIVAIAPVWLYFAGPGLTGVPTVVEWLTAAMLPFFLLITIASWLEPRGA